jgi:hypothetical protein
MAFQREISRHANAILPSTLLARLCWQKGMPRALVQATTFFKRWAHAKLPAAHESGPRTNLARHQA